MHKGLLRSAFLGGLIVFGWHMVSWMGLPWHMATLNIFNNEKQVAQTIAENTSKPGMYVLPKMEPGKDEKEGFHHDEVGSGKTKPLMFAVVQNQDMNPKSIPSYFGILITYIIAAFFITMIAVRLKSSSYMEKVGMITLIGLTIGIVAYVPSCIWWGFSTAFSMVGILDQVIAWFLAGLVIAKICK